MSVASISVRELADLRRAASPHALLDVREAGELAVCRMDGAIHIPMADIPRRLNELPQDVKLVVMCHHGMRSLRVAQYLQQAGFGDAVNLEGGIDAWAEAVEPGMARY